MFIRNILNEEYCPTLSLICISPDSSTPMISAPSFFCEATRNSVNSIFVSDVPILNYFQLVLYLFSANLLAGLRCCFLQQKTSLMFGTNEDFGRTNFSSDFLNVLAQIKKKIHPSQSISSFCHRCESRFHVEFLEELRRIFVLVVVLIDFKAPKFDYAALRFSFRFFKRTLYLFCSKQ